MRGVFDAMSGEGFPAEVVDAIRDSVDCNIYFFDKKVGEAEMYMILCGSVVLLICLCVALNIRAGRKKK